MHTLLSIHRPAHDVGTATSRSSDLLCRVHAHHRNGVRVRIPTKLSGLPIPVQFMEQMMQPTVKTCALEANRIPRFSGNWWGINSFHNDIRKIRVLDLLTKDNKWAERPYCLHNDSRCACVLWSLTNFRQTSFSALSSLMNKEPSTRLLSDHRALGSARPEHHYWQRHQF